jgi:hypothetical protein
MSETATKEVARRGRDREIRRKCCEEVPEMRGSDPMLVIGFPSEPVHRPDARDERILNELPAFTNIKIRGGRPNVYGAILRRVLLYGNSSWVIDAGVHLRVWPNHPSNKRDFSWTVTAFGI